MVAKTVDLIKAKGGKVTREPGPVKGGKSVIAFIEDPDGYKFELLERGPTPEPFCQVMLRVGDLDRSINFYEKLLRKLDNPEYKVLEEFCARAPAFYALVVPAIAGCLVQEARLLRSKVRDFGFFDRWFRWFIFGETGNFSILTYVWLMLTSDYLLSVRAAVWRRCCLSTLRLLLLDLIRFSPRSPRAGDGFHKHMIYDPDYRNWDTIS
ncbi:hypothetical protein GW17_00054495 [Ensete ventricosum]|nr:hypothetical protein GW17_00054495 [Ensete ventricosum]